MKKLFLLTAVLLGATAASHAGISLSIGIGFPAPPFVIFSRPAPVYVQPAPVICHPTPVLVARPPVHCAPAPIVVASPPVYYYPYPHHHYVHHRGWERHYGYSHGR